jgi:hypothetical protein
VDDLPPHRRRVGEVRVGVRPSKRRVQATLAILERLRRVVIAIFVR